MAMARPRRPQSEVDAVRDAAELVRKDMPNASTPAIAQEIAVRVVTALIEEIDKADDDPFTAALEALARSLMLSPIQQLATCPDIDTLAMYRGLWASEFSALAGQILSASQQIRMRAVCVDKLRQQLADRYLRALRTSG